MDFKQLIIVQKETHQRFVFNKKINLVVSTELSDELLKANFNLKDSLFEIENCEEKLSDLFQIKVRIAATGIVMVNFLREQLTPEQKEVLIGEISALKDNIEPSIDSQKTKIQNLIEIVSKYDPLFVGYANTGDFVFTRLTFEEILAEKELNFPILIMLTSLDFADEIVKKPKNHILKILKEKEQQNKPEKPQKESKDPSEFLNKFADLDFIFFGIFSLFVSFGTIVSGYEIANGDSIFIFLIILTVVFVIVLYYAINRSHTAGTLVLKPKELLVPTIYITLGVILGTLIGFIVTKFVIVLKEGVALNYGLLYAFGVVLPLIIGIVGLFSPLLIKPLKQKIGRNKQ